MKSRIRRNNAKPVPLPTMPSLAIVPTSIRLSLFVSFLLIPSFHCFLLKKENVIWNKMQKSEKVSTEKNRAAAVALIAEIRRIKARLMEAVPKLQKSAKKVKGLSKGELQTRFDLVLAIIERIKAIRDGSTPAENQTGGCRTSSSNKNIKFDSSECLDSGFYRRTEELDQFRQDHEMRKKKQASKIVSDISVHYHLNVYNMCMQDEGLDVISEGLDMLKNIALDMNEEIDRRAPLMDEIDSMVDQTTSGIRKNNVTLKQTITQIRSGRNFSIDITLLCIILGIAFYLNNTMK